MPAHQTSAVVADNQSVTVTDVPFPKGQIVEVIVRAKDSTAPSEDRYPLRGTVVSYVEPTQSVDDDQWEAMR